MNHKEKALNYFSQQLHCSQSVIAAFADEMPQGVQQNRTENQQKCSLYWTGRIWPISRQTSTHFYISSMA